MDNLFNSSNNILTRASRHLRHQHNSRHRRSDGIGKAKMIYTQCFVPCNSLN